MGEKQKNPTHMPIKKKKKIHRVERADMRF